MAILKQNSKRQKMKCYNFIISYDIANDKRLRKIAKLLEKEAIRVQFSIFYLPNTTKKELQRLLDRLLQLYNENEDDIRVYNIKNSGIKLAAATDLEHPYNFL